MEKDVNPNKYFGLLDGSSTNAAGEKQTYSSVWRMFPSGSNYLHCDFYFQLSLGNIPLVFLVFVVLFLCFVKQIHLVPN